MLNPLIRSHTLVAEGLDFAFCVLVMGCAVGKLYNSLDSLTSVLVGYADYGTFKHVRVLHNHVFNLKRSYTEASCLNQIIGSADIPVVAVLVLVSSVACVVNSALPDIFVKIFVAVVLHKNSVLLFILRRINNDFACFVCAKLLAAVVNDVNVVKRSGLAH